MGAGMGSKKMNGSLLNIIDRARFLADEQRKAWLIQNAKDQILLAELTAAFYAETVEMQNAVEKYWSLFPRLKDPCARLPGSPSKSAMPRR